MTDQERNFLAAINKTPRRSKKFIAFFFSIIMIAGILVAALLTQQFVWAMAVFMSIGMLAIASISIGYVLSQNALDKFIQGVAHLGGIGDAIIPKDTVD